jgi:L-2-hydroxyglutarate oxidase LhgO
MASLGIHTTLDLDGRMSLGPSSQYVNDLDYTVNASNKKLFYESARRFLPFLEYDDLEPEMAGIRPKLQPPGGEFKDFIIRDESDRDLPGLINLIGIESPGLTASPAIAEYVASLAEDLLA